jgi:hypothetical protein
MMHQPLTDAEVVERAKAAGYKPASERTFRTFLGAAMLLRMIGVQGEVIRLGFDHYLPVKG